MFFSYLTLPEEDLSLHENNDLQVVCLVGHHDHHRHQKTRGREIHDVNDDRMRHQVMMMKSGGR
jgi:hypothetical protein